MMQEQDPSKLKNALRQLPSYLPPEELWQAIRADLRQQEADGPLQQALSTLPFYEPPAKVWQGIEQQLQERQPTPLLRRVWFRLATAAAILSGCLWFVQGLQPASVDYEFVLSTSQEQVDARLLARDWQQDQAGFQTVAQICEQKPFLCSNSDIQSIQTELEELTAAKESLEKALGNYGTDAFLIQELKEIELERTELLKKMVERLI